MPTATEIIKSLENDGDRWLCRDDRLHMYIKNGPVGEMNILIELNGRTFIMYDGRVGEVKWWPWTRWRIAYAAKRRNFINQSFQSRVENIMEVTCS